MTIQDLGSIGEIVGAVATVATLVYLAVQIRANTQLMRAQSQRGHQSAHAQYALKIAENPQLADVFGRGMADFESLSPSERMQFIFLFSQVVGIVELAYGDWTNGVTDRAQLERAVAGVVVLLGSPGGRTYWYTWAGRGGYSQGFRSYIDTKLNAPGAPGSANPESAA